MKLIGVMFAVAFINAFGLMPCVATTCESVSSLKLPDTTIAFFPDRSYRDVCSAHAFSGSWSSRRSNYHFAEGSCGVLPGSGGCQAVTGLRHQVRSLDACGQLERQVYGSRKRRHGWID
jgi:hypothetical protein